MLEATIPEISVVVTDHNIINKGRKKSVAALSSDMLKAIQIVPTLPVGTLPVETALHPLLLAQIKRQSVLSPKTAVSGKTGLARLQTVIPQSLLTAYSMFKTKKLLLMILVLLSIQKPLTAAIADVLPVENKVLC